MTRTFSLVTAVVLVWSGMLGAASPALAAGVTFSDAKGSATFGKGVDFSAVLTTDVPLARLELRVRLPASLGPVIIPVDAPPSGGAKPVTAGWSLERDGHLVPNTLVRGQWVAYPNGDGAPVTSQEVRVRYQDTRFDWKTVSGDVVRVHWTNGDDAFGRRALQIGERAIREVSSLLGVQERDPIDFYIYADEPSFRDALGPRTRENVGGQAHADIRTLFALITPADIDASWVGIVVPHELTHLVFSTTVDNPYRFPPRWLNEGLAVYLSQGYDRSDRDQVGRAARSGDLIPLTGLGSQFPTTFDGFSLAYAESVSAVDFLVHRFDRDALVGLVRRYHDGLSDDDAFRKALGEDLTAFQKAWYTDLGAQEPQRRGPQPAAPGPVPPGWNVAVPRSTPAVSTSPAGPAATEPPGAPAARGQGPDLIPIAIAGLLVIGAVGAGLYLGRPARRTR